MVEPRTKTIALVAAGMVLLAAAGAGAGWLLGRSKAADSRQASTSEGTSAESSTSTASPDATMSTDATVATPPQQPAAEPQPQPGGDTAPSGPTEHQPGYVVGTTTVDGSYVLKIDYVQFLTGGEAADAAAAHGDESPPPNDYYIVNDNPKIRQFKIKSGISVFVVNNDDGTSDAPGHTVPLATWIAELNGPQADAFRGTLYWVTVTDGIITKIDAQYVP